jgi:peptide methionine sulfoxide reductase MsrA
VTDPVTSTSPTLHPSGEPRLETALLAGGCFWGMQDLIRKIPGVVRTDVGYTGGATAAPGYHEVKTGRTGHAEAVRVVFDPKQLSYADLLEKWFFRSPVVTELAEAGPYTPAEDYHQDYLEKNPGGYTCHFMRD